ncbi:N-acetylmuramoyl-L-alanine amidase [Nocardioides sp. TRM66260-LWL]|uniref:N-acetylmuramoyl-L-alanine amidase family protein n=1 Tax=Nocardioides sp. TRM66260-LWL TaxID=2874478 RepID=UPI001CC6A7D0|nr:N-acetylmuramoyl-L-alanine amidase [Nocardioides sp. TRM66260-LWL]MBZ5735948.1 N-acetylmuramoyl-L-alanine amidase [Nocardioides sp. TRM66260-LWL]
MLSDARTPLGLGLAAALVAIGGIAARAAAPDPSADSAGPAAGARPAVALSAATPARDPEVAARPLAGRVVVLDPGHQLGNRHFPRQIARPVPAGGFTKPCNTTGTATDGGYPEATLTWSVARRLERRLEALGARVVLTRTSNRDDRWGPCVDARGRAGAAAHADLTVSLHGDGSTQRGAHGFHVIVPPSRAPWTDDIAAPSRRLGLDLRAALHGAGLPYATYVAGGDGLDVRSDLATLNLSDVPVAMVELGNMRSRVDAARMTDARGRDGYAAALAAGIRTFLGRR